MYREHTQTKIKNNHQNRFKDFIVFKLDTVSPGILVSPWLNTAEYSPRKTCTTNGKTYVTHKECNNSLTCWIFNIPRVRLRKFEVKRARMGSASDRPQQQAMYKSSRSCPRCETLSKVWNNCRKHNEELVAIYMFSKRVPGIIPIKWNELAWKLIN